MEEEIEKKQFDFNDAVQQLLSGKNGILAPLVKQLVEAALEAQNQKRILSMYGLGLSYKDIIKHIVIEID